MDENTRQRWEYCFLTVEGDQITVVAPDVEDSDEEEPTTLLLAMTMLGDTGWEMCGNVVAGGSGMIFFKRPKN